jgi:hypothetical protein
MKKFFAFAFAICVLIFVVSCEEDGKTIYHGDTEHEDDSDIVDTGTEDSDVSDSETPDGDSSDTEIPEGDEPDTGDDSDTDDDTDTTDDTDTIDDTDTTDDTDFEPVDPACQEIVFDEIASTLEDGIYAYVADPEDPENALFWLDIMFYEYDPEYQEQVYRTDLSPFKGKTVVFGKDANANYATATEKAILYKNVYDEEGYMMTKYYFAKSGSLTIEDVIEGTNYSKGKGSFSFYEVMIDDNEVSTYVESGECFAVSDFAWDNVIANPPECMEDSDCGENEVCDEGFCETSEDFYCDDDTDCESGFCFNHTCYAYTVKK